jgi:hypothetical protein
MIKKITLSEKSIYFGNVKMPKNFEIDKEKLTENIFNSNYYENFSYPFSIALDKLKNYITDFIRLEHGLNLIPVKSYGKFFQTNEISEPIIEFNFYDLKNSEDFVFLYGVEIDPKTCNVIINYEDNKKIIKNYNYLLENNNFLMFPATESFYIKNLKNNHLNFIQIITFKIV